jgi:transposase InsO family protein
LSQRVSRKRVARLMRRAGLSARFVRRWRATTDSQHGLPVAPNVVARRFNADAPNRVWVTDMTYVRTWEGWLYLAAIIDVFSRRVVGWAMADHLRTELPLEALGMALGIRQPAVGLVHHSDRGCQYASETYRSELAARGIVCSMSRVGDCWDNAVAESFFATLKVELIYRRPWPTKAEARAAIHEYIAAFYNPHRRHSALGYLSPMAYEVQHAAAVAA